MPQLFVSHCTQDADFAQRIAAGLRDAGVEVWIAPNSIHPGEAFVDAIERGLDGTTHFVLIMSPEAFDSNWVKLEMNTAIRLEREGRLTISPILYRACKAPLLLGNFQWIEYQGDEQMVIRQVARWAGIDLEEGGQRSQWAQPRVLSEEQLAGIKTGLLEIANEIAVCTLCPLHQDRNQTVPGDGCLTARLMLIGEAPGPEDDQTGKAFVSTAGQFLNELLEMSNIRRADVFMTNVVKCRPTRQRKPEPGEIRACCDTYLDRQIALINPPVVVPLGAYALGRIMPGAKLSAIHGQPKEVGGRIVIPMYHPAAGLYHHQYRNKLIKDFLEMGRYLAARQPA